MIGGFWEWILGYVLVHAIACIITLVFIVVIFCVIVGISALVIAVRNRFKGKKP